MLHPVEDRICCVREYLALMGMPNDFEWYGDLDLNVNKIGQNVPVKTAKFIVSECVKHLLKWDVEPIDNNKNSGFQDNIQCLEIW
jgi:site-specific DNA-cytosine methylase